MLLGTQRGFTRSTEAGFVRVVENGSFTRAAAQLVVAQSALSRKVRELEEELGTQLLHRDGHGVLPTDAGLQLFTRARACWMKRKRC